MKWGILRRYDWMSLAPTILLSVLGLVVLYSSAIKSSEVVNQLDTSRQIIYFGAGLVLMVIMSRLDYRVLKNYSYILYIIMLLLLFAVDVFGATRLGATRWISIGFFQFQPSEFAKLCLIVVLANFYAKNYDQTHRLRYTFYSFGLLLVPIGLVMAQPDLGTALVMIFIWLCMAFASRLKKRWFVAFGTVFTAAIPLIVPRLQQYQRDRLLTFFNPTANPTTTGYNVNQAIIAVGSGGWFGQGLGAGSQSQGNFLPSQHTDFIFAVLAEKLGFVGSLLTIGLFLLLVARILILAITSLDRFGSFLAIGIAGMFLFHFFVNIGMNVGLLPVTGIPLPFVSAGGTSMLISMLAIGVVQSIYAHRKKRAIS